MLNALLEIYMEPAPVIDYINHILPGARFTLVDVGCSGGLGEEWRRFGRRLRAIAFDPSVDEIERLRRVETSEDVKYVAAFATIPKDHPFAQKKGERDHWSRNPWDRLSVTKWQENSASERAEMDSGDLASSGLWTETRLVDPAQEIVISDYLRRVGLDSVDFVKIDIDGRDLEVLHSMDAVLDEFTILGLMLEVNFFGSDAETDHTFHNTDRFLKSKRFELFDLTARRYSLATLPGRFKRLGGTRFGRVLQGDALYLRDLANPINSDLASRMTAERLLNLICLFALFRLPDCAADVAVGFRDKISPVCDVDHLLDLLAVQAQTGVRSPLSYEEYLSRFEARDSMFFPADEPVGPEPTMAPDDRRVAAMNPHRRFTEVFKELFLSQWRNRK
jgi:FkbM family methyltransferase